jgi:hypothetical protein
VKIEKHVGPLVHVPDHAGGYRSRTSKETLYI